MRGIASVTTLLATVTVVEAALGGDPAAPSAAPNAAPSAAPSAQETPEGAEARAREHFDKGRKLLVEGAFGAALPEFLESRRIFPSRSATSSAAVCLRKLERYDEALFLMEALLREFSDLPADVKAAAQTAIIEMRGLVGTVEISGAETGTTIIIDGQVKGEYPLLTPLRVSAGGHLVRFYKEGFETEEVRVDVKGQGSASVAVRLKRLLQAGKLRVDEALGQKLQVVIDGTAVGVTPWEGPVAAGEHSVALRGDGGLGTSPKTVNVQVNKETALSLTAEKLDATLRVVPTPVDASVAVDGIFVGRGVFDGRLRPGSHKVKVIADGYFASEHPVNSKLGGDNIVVVQLERDPNAPTWRAPGRFSLEAVGAGAVSPTFGGDVAACASCEVGLGAGVGVTIYGGFETWSKLSFGASVGYLYVLQKVADRTTELQVFGASPDHGTVTDELTLRAFQVGAWAAYRLGTERIPVRARVGAGALVGTMSDRRTGTFRAGGRTDACEPGSSALHDADCFAVGPLSEAPFVSFFYVAPELRVGYRLNDHLELSVGVQALISFGLLRSRWNSDSPLPNQDHPVNASPDGYGTFASETLAGTVHVTVLPGASARYAF